MTTVELLKASEVRRMIRAIPSEMRPALRDEIVLFTRPIVEEQKALVDWSSSGPSALGTRVLFGAGRAGAQIRFDASKAPHVPLYETDFRRMVYGKAWVAQEGRPFFYGPTQGKTAALRAHGQQAIRTALRNAAR